MRSLFVKVFLWFWLAMTLSGLALFVIGFATRSGPAAEHRERMDEQLRHLVGQTLAVYGETAARLLERNEMAAFEDYTARLEQTAGLRVVLVLRGTEARWDRQATSQARGLASRAIETGDTQFIRVDGEPTFAATTATPNGTRYAIAAAPVGRHSPWFGPSGPPPGSSFFAELPRFARGFSMPMLVSFVVGGLVSLGLAWHLTAPVRRLRMAAQRLARGDLSTRVGAAVVQGHDEVAALGRDFDVMAERIEGLLTSQQQLLRDISHELRSPLARLNVALELARQRSSSEAQGALDRIEREGERLNELIGQLLTLNQLESDGNRINREPVALGSLVEAIVADADFEAQMKNRRVYACVDGALMIRGSEEMLRRAIENVVRNGVRYTAEHTSVEVTVAPHPEHTNEVVVRIRDHGPGVPESALSQLFLPFYRVADARDRQSGGTGIGLAITERAVRLHNGTVTAANAPDGGLIVEIVLPVGT